jgi:hypothetical protein
VATTATAPSATAPETISFSNDPLITTPAICLSPKSYLIPLPSRAVFDTVPWPQTVVISRKLSMPGNSA